MNKKLAKWLLSKLAPYKEMITLDKASNDYAEHCCKFNRWQKYERRNYLTREYVAISQAFMNGYILCMHQNDLSFKNGLILKEQKAYLPSYMVNSINNDLIANEKEKMLNIVENALKQHLNEYNVNEIMSTINHKCYEK